MSELIWKVARPLTDKAPISKLEGIVGATLPDDFVGCVMENNAGYPSLKGFETAAGTARVFNNLLTFDEGKSVNIFNTYEGVLAATGNDALLPFAEDPFGNYICFDFSESGAVVFLEHETNKTEAVSETFTGFITKLTQTN
jgi:hypothetical protein